MEQFIADLTHHLLSFYKSGAHIRRVIVNCAHLASFIEALNVPGIIGLIIAGVIIGPHGLDLISDSECKYVLILDYSISCLLLD